MREFELIIDEELKRGLRTEKVTSSGNRGLWGCLGFRCGTHWLEGYTHLDHHIGGPFEISYSWPFPQFIFQDRHRILVIRDDLTSRDIVYSVNDDYSVMTQLFALNHGIYGIGTLMEVADFGEYIFMTNGVAMIHYEPIGGWQVDTVIPTIPMMRTVCNFKGQLIGGCVLSDWHGCNDSYLVWSKIGNVDFTPGRSNEAGYRRHPHGGEVYHVRRLGDFVVAYSNKGIVQMFPVKEPAPTFGFNELLDVGLANRGAMSGSKNEHVFVSSDYYLYRVTEKGLEKLGYQEYMEELTVGEIIVCYDAKKGDFFIGDREKTYLLSKQGLTEIPQHPSAVWSDQGGTYILPDTVDSYEPLIITEIVDMGYRGLKTIFEVEASALLTLGAMVSVSWTNDLMVWGDTPWLQCNPQGVAYPIISGADFLLNLKFTMVGDFSTVNYIKARYKMTDLRIFC